MKKKIALSVALCLLLGALSACGGNTGDGTTAEDQSVTTEARTEIEATTGALTDVETADATTEKETESESETETELVFEAALPEGEADISYTTGDGYVMEQYSGAELVDYLAACLYFEEQGMTRYASNWVGEAISATYLDQNGYRTVMFNGNKSELYLGKSADGAILPGAAEYGQAKYEVTVTQKTTTQINGMGYVIRLSDGSFIVVDGGYKEEAKELYRTLIALNGSAESIHIRAWIITHSHGDHYQAFNQFSKDYGSKVTLDYLLYSPVSGAANQDSYLNSAVKIDLARFKGAKICYVHTGMNFNFGSVVLEILVAPEQIYKQNAPEDFNETSLVFRVKNPAGSMIFLADSGEHASAWLVDTYGDALKSDMLQISHHGCETATAELYDKIRANTAFWPCDETLFASYRGELVKQHIIEAEYSKEHLLHSYGRITRPLSYKAQGYEYVDLFPRTSAQMSTSAYAENARLEDGVIKFEVKGDPEKLDPYVFYVVKNVETSDVNAIRIVCDSAAAKVGTVFFTCGSDATGKYTAAKSNPIGVTGASDDGKTTMIAYLGDTDGYTGRLTSLRIDLGSEVGQTVTIYSVEGFYIDVD